MLCKKFLSCHFSREEVYICDYHSPLFQLIILQSYIMRCLEGEADHFLCDLNATWFSPVICRVRSLAVTLKLNANYWFSNQLDVGRSCRGYEVFSSSPVNLAWFISLITKVVKTSSLCLYNCFVSLNFRINSLLYLYFVLDFLSDKYCWYNLLFSYNFVLFTDCMISKWNYPVGMKSCNPVTHSQPTLIL